MPEPEYMPIPGYIYAIACALVKTKRDDESPVVIRVEDISAGPLLVCVPRDDASTAYTVYPVTFVATYTAHDAGRDRTTGGRISVQTFDGWDCLHSIIAEPGCAAEPGQIVGDVDNA